MDQIDGPISARAAEQNRDSKLSRATATSRRHPAPGLMALRVFAMVLVLIGHSAATYTIMRDPSLPWILFEPHGSQTLDFLGFACRELALPLFFLLAGISAEYGAARKSAWEFLAPRLSRLVVPLLLAGLTLFPLTGAIWLYGLKVGNTNHMTDAQRVTLEMRLDASNPLQWGLLHCPRFRAVSAL